MKFIKTRSNFLYEAKIRDLILPRQASEFKVSWGESYLDYEEVTPTDKIKQGKWKLSEEDKNKVLSAFFQIDDIGLVFKIFTDLPDKFAYILSQSLNLSNVDEKEKIILQNFNPQKPTIDQIIIVYNNVFRKLSVSDTMASEMLMKDVNGRPVKDEEGNNIKVPKAPGDPIYSNNLVNINSFITDYNRCYPDDKVDADFSDFKISAIRNMASEVHNREYKTDFAIFGRDMYLSISHNPKDILNMSISQFYSSCQHLYSGSYRSQLLGNVFDPNSIPAFLIFDTPIFWGEDKLSDQLPLTRMMVRNIESFSGSEEKIFFDRAYPDRMKDIFDEIVPKYSDNKGTSDSDNTRYIFTPDLPMGDDLNQPYMDRINLTRFPYIGANTKSIYLNRTTDWSKVRIAPNAKIKEIIIETTEIPDFSKVDLKPDWIKFKLLSVKSLDAFSGIKTNSIAFDKCKVDPKVFDDMSVNNPDISKISLVSCELSSVDIDLSNLKKLTELSLIYTLDSVNEIDSVIKGSSIKKLIISGDLIRSKEDRAYVNSLKSKTLKIEITGPVI